MEENKIEIMLTNHRFVRFEDSLIWYTKDWKLICELWKACRWYRQYAFMGFTINSFLLNMLNDNVILHCSSWYQTVWNIKKLWWKCMWTPNYCDRYVNSSIFKKTLEELENQNLDEEIKTFRETTNYELNSLYDKQKWEPEDVSRFSELRKFKYWADRIEKSSWEFHEIRKQHTKPTSKSIRSRKECNIKFHNEWFESLENDWSFEWFKPPFTPYHDHIVDIDLDYIIWVWWKFRRQGKTYYLCMWQYEWMWLFTDGIVPESFSKLEFDNRNYTIDSIVKDAKDYKCTWTRKAYHIYKNVG